jgi:hypothetical protein
MQPNHGAFCLEAATCHIGCTEKTSSSGPFANGDFLRSKQIEPRRAASDDGFGGPANEHNT